MSEICNKCGRDTAKDEFYWKFRDRITDEKEEIIGGRKLLTFVIIEESEPYIVCKNCYQTKFQNCPNCGSKMQSEDAGIGEIEVLFCKCRPTFDFYGEIQIRRNTK